MTVLVTFSHLRALEYCKPRIAAWCEEHGYQLRDFRDGVSADELRKTGCAMAIKAADYAEACATQDAE